MEGLEMLPAAPEGAVEGDLISQTAWGAVRSLFEQGWSKRSIARELCLDIKTVRKWARRNWEPQRRRRSRGKKLEPFAQFLEGRAPEVGFNGKVLLRELRGLGYEGSYSVLADSLAPVRRQFRDPIPTVRFETGPGQQAQVDWGTTWTYLGEERSRIHVFTMVLGYSRRIFARAYESEGLTALLDGHERAFSHFGGRTETILYDNPRTIVREKDEATGRVVWNGSFKDRMDFWGVEVKLCRYYRAQTKGKVESGVKYVKRNALAGRRFRDLEDLNDYLLRWCVEQADQRIHGTTHEKPAERFARETLASVDLRPAPPKQRWETRIVPKDAFVAVETNRYPVPFEWVGKQVEVGVLPEEIAIGCGENDPIRHRRLFGKHQVLWWSGRSRQRAVPKRPPMEGPPRFDPAYLESAGEIAHRSLEIYGELAQEVSR
jgi:transposase